MKFSKYLSILSGLEEQGNNVLDIGVLRTASACIFTWEEYRWTLNSEQSLILNLNASTASLALYMILQNISLGNDAIDNNLIPKIVEISAWILEVDWVSIFLYDSEKQNLYLKASTGKLNA